MGGTTSSSRPEEREESRAVPTEEGSLRHFPQAKKKLCTRLPYVAEEKKTSGIWSTPAAKENTTIRAPSNRKEGKAFSRFLNLRRAETLLEGIAILAA